MYDQITIVNPLLTPPPLSKQMMDQQVLCTNVETCKSAYLVGDDPVDLLLTKTKKKLHLILLFLTSYNINKKKKRISYW